MMYYDAPDFNSPTVIKEGAYETSCQNARRITTQHLTVGTFCVKLPTCFCIEETCSTTQISPTLTERPFWMYDPEADYFENRLPQQTLEMGRRTYEGVDHASISEREYGESHLCTTVFRANV